MTRCDLHTLFKRHHGSITRVARKAKVSSEAVSHWLKGSSNSIPIESAALNIARKLLATDAKINAIRADLSREARQTTTA